MAGLIKGKYFEVPLVVYPFTIMVSIGESNEQLKKRFEAQKVDYGDYFDEDITRGRTTFFKSKHTCMRFVNYVAADLNTIVHECFHAVTLIFDCIGLEFNLDYNDEAYAYLIGYLVEEIYKKI